MQQLLFQSADVKLFKGLKWIELQHNVCMLQQKNCNSSGIFSSTVTFHEKCSIENNERNREEDEDSTSYM